MVLRSDAVGQLRELHLHFPTDVFPVLTRTSELQRLGVLPAIGLSDPNREYSSVHEGEDQIARGDFTHRLVKGIPCTVGVALGRPEITALNFVAVGLILIDPPVAHIRAA